MKHFKARKSFLFSLLFLILLISLFVTTTFSGAATISAPAAPLSLNITNLYCNLDRLTWQIPNDSNATSWKIYRAQANQSNNYALLQTVTNPTILTYEDVGEKEAPINGSYKLGSVTFTGPGQGKFAYKIQATNAGGDSPYSAATTFVNTNTGCNPQPNLVCKASPASSKVGGTVTWSLTNKNATPITNVTWKDNAGHGGNRTGTNPFIVDYAQPGSISMSATAYTGSGLSQYPSAIATCSTSITSVTYALVTNVQAKKTTGNTCDNDVVVTWSAPASLPKGSTYGYDVYRVDSASGLETQVLTNNPSLTYTDKTAGLPEGANYYYRVSLEVNGVAHPETAAKSATIARPPVCVLPLTATCTVSPTSVKTGETATWNLSISGAKPPYSYVWSGNITDSTMGAKNIVGKTLTSTSGLATFPIQYNSTGTRSASVKVTSSDGKIFTTTAGGTCSLTVASTSTVPPVNPPVTPIPPSAPTPFPAMYVNANIGTSCGGSVYLSWTATKYLGAGYNVYRSTSQSGQYTKIVETSGIPAYLDETTGNSFDTTYYYRIYGVTNGVESQDYGSGSAVSSSMCPIYLPDSLPLHNPTTGDPGDPRLVLSTPKDGASVCVGTKIDLDWEDSLPKDSYRLYRQFIAASTSLSLSTDIADADILSAETHYKAMGIPLGVSTGSSGTGSGGSDTTAFFLQSYADFDASHDWTTEFLSDTGTYTYKVATQPGASVPVISNSVTVKAIPCDISGLPVQEREAPSLYNETAAAMVTNTWGIDTFKKPYRELELAIQGHDNNHGEGSFLNYIVFVKDYGNIQNPQFGSNLFYIDAAPASFPPPYNSVSSGRTPGITLYAGTDANPNPKDKDIFLYDFGGKIGKLWVKDPPVGETDLPNKIGAPVYPFGQYFRALINPAIMPQFFSLGEAKTYTPEEFARYYFRAATVKLSGAAFNSSYSFSSKMKDFEGSNIVSASDSLSGTLLLRSSENEAFRPLGQNDPTKPGTQFLLQKDSTTSDTVTGPKGTTVYDVRENLSTRFFPVPTLVIDGNSGLKMLYSLTMGAAGAVIEDPKILEEKGNSYYNGSTPAPNLSGENDAELYAEYYDCIFETSSFDDCQKKAPKFTASRIGFIAKEFSIFGGNDTLYYNDNTQDNNDSSTSTRAVTGSLTAPDITVGSYLTYGGLYDRNTGNLVKKVAYNSSEKSIFASIVGWLRGGTSSVATVIKSVLGFFSLSSNSQLAAAYTAHTSRTTPRDTNTRNDTGDNLTFKALAANYSLFGGCQDIISTPSIKVSKTGKSYSSVLAWGFDSEKGRDMYTAVLPAQAQKSMLGLCVYPYLDANKSASYNEVNTVYNDYYRDHNSWNEMYVSFPMPDAFSMAPNIVTVDSPDHKYPSAELLKKYYMVIENPNPVHGHASKVKALIISRGPEALSAKNKTTGKNVVGRPDTIGISGGVQTVLGLTPTSTINAWLIPKDDMDKNTSVLEMPRPVYVEPGHELIYTSNL